MVTKKRIEQMELICTVALLMVSLLESLVANTKFVDNPYRTEYVEVKFGELSTWNKRAVDIIVSMERDLVFPNNLLIGGLKTIQTLNFTDAEVLIGCLECPGSYANGNRSEARIYGAYTLQLNADVIIFADSNNHCIRKLYRTTLIVEDFVGRCESSGYEDGVGVNASLSSPFNMAKLMESDIVYFSSARGHIHELDIATKYVKTVFQDPSGFIYSMSLHPFVTSTLIVATLNQTYLLHVPSNNSQRLTGDNVYYPDQIRALDNKLYIFSSSLSYSLFFLDTMEEKVWRVCIEGRANLDGPIEKCSFGSPGAMLVNRSSLYMCDSPSSIREMTVNVNVLGEETLPFSSQRRGTIPIGNWLTFGIYLMTMRVVI